MASRKLLGVILKTFLSPRFTYPIAGVHALTRTMHTYSQTCQLRLLSFSSAFQEVPFFFEPFLLLFETQWRCFWCLFFKLLSSSQTLEGGLWKEWCTAFQGHSSFSCCLMQTCAMCLRAQHLFFWINDQGSCVPWAFSITWMHLNYCQRVWSEQRSANKSTHTRMLILLFCLL